MIPPNLELGLRLQCGFVDFAEDMLPCCDDPASGRLVTDEGGGQGGQLGVGMGTWTNYTYNIIHEKDLSPVNMTMDTRWVSVLAVLSVLATLWRGECQAPRVHSCRRSPRLIRRAEVSEARSGTSCQVSSTRAWSR